MRQSSDEFSTNLQESALQCVDVTARESCPWAVPSFPHSLLWAFVFLLCLSLLLTSGKVLFMGQRQEEKGQK